MPVQQVPEGSFDTGAFTNLPEVQQCLAQLRERFHEQNPLIISDMLDEYGNQYVNLVQKGGGVFDIIENLILLPRIKPKLKPMKIWLHRCYVYLVWTKWGLSLIVKNASRKDGGNWLLKNGWSRNGNNLFGIGCSGERAGQGA